MKDQDDKSDLWNRLHGLGREVVEAFGVADGGKYRWDKSEGWNKQHGRVPTPPVVQKPKPGTTQPIETPPDPPAGDLVLEPNSLVFYKHDGKMRGLGLPQTATALTKQFKPMSASMIAMWQAGLKVLHPTMPAATFDRNWHGLTRSNAGFNNQNGSDTDHFKIECGVFCPGATLRVVNGVVYRKAGELWMDVWAFDPVRDYPAPQWMGDIDMTRWFFPNTAPNDNDVNPFFNNFGGRCIVPIWYPKGIMPVRYARLVVVPRPLNPFVLYRPEVTAGLIPA